MDDGQRELAVLCPIRVLSGMYAEKRKNITK
jgi:hypothetical protein